jgi:DNA polymerase delta subunit 1
MARLFLVEVDVLCLEDEGAQLEALRSNDLSYAARDFYPVEHLVTHAVAPPAAHRLPRRRAGRQRCYYGRLWCKDELGRHVCVGLVDVVSTCYLGLRDGASLSSARCLAVALGQHLCADFGKGAVVVEAIERHGSNGWCPEAKLWLRVASATPDSRATLERAAATVERGLGASLLTPRLAEARVGVITELLQTLRLRVGTWFQVRQGAAGAAESCPWRFQDSVAFMQTTRASIDALPEHADALPGLRVLSLDIECVSDSGAFPDATKPLDRCVCVGLVARTLFQECQERPEVDAEAPRALALCLGATAPVEGVEVRAFDSERELLLALAPAIRELSPDVLVGYNQTTFDWAYLRARCACLLARGEMSRGDVENFGRLSLCHRSACAFQDRAAQRPIRPLVPGAFEVDLWQWLKQDNYGVEDLPDLKLDTVAKRFLGGVGKHDLPAQLLFQRAREGPAGRAEVAAYCVQDTRLVLDLLVRLEVLGRVLMIARICWTTPSEVLFRGQQLRVYAQLRAAAHDRGFVLEDQAGDDEASLEPYHGAQVLAPKSGFYQVPVVTLDYASLYPSIIIAHNICFTTLAATGDIAIPEVPHRFVHASTRQGLLPMVLEELLLKRAAVKRQMAEVRDPGRRALLNNLQLALKVSANSVYGFTGATRSLLPCRPVAESTTAMGRHIIAFTRSTLLADFPGCDVIYGDTDSCFVRFPETSQTSQTSAGAATEGSAALPELPALFAEAERMASGVTARLEAKLEAHGAKRGILRLEVEKVFASLLLSDKKKRYAGYCHESPTKDGKLLVRGIELVRKDSVPLVRACQAELLDALLRHLAVPQAVAIVKSYLERVLAHRPGDDLEPFVQSKELKSKYSRGEAQPHVVVNSLQRSRAPGSEVREGERVRYVVVASAACPRIVDKVEAAAYAAAEALPLDWAHYVDVLAGAAGRLLEPLRHTHSDAAADLEAAMDLARRKAEKLVVSWSMSRSASGAWRQGVPSRGGTQLQLFKRPRCE